MILVSRFRSSHHCAAPSFANFGIKGTLAIYDSSAVFGFEVPKQTRGHNDRNFKSTALASSDRKECTYAHSIDAHCRCGAHAPGYERDAAIGQRTARLQRRRAAGDVEAAGA